MRNLLKSKLKLTTLLVASLQLAGMSGSAVAGERESLEQLRATTSNLVELLVQEGVLSKRKADRLLEEAQRGAETARAQDAAHEKARDAATDEAITNAAVNSVIDDKLVRVQYVPEVVKQQMKNDIKADVMEQLNYKAGERLGMPSWLDRFTWYGEVRFRYEHQGFSEDNPRSDFFNTANFLDGTDFALPTTTEDNNRLRIRGRLGLNAKVNDWLDAGMRITTGGQNDSLSGNATQEAASSKYTFALDRVFLKANVKPWLTVHGGRFENPFMYTELVWDNDLPFDGVAATFSKPINKRLTAFGTLGAFPLDDLEKNEINQADSKWMYGSQVGLKWTSNNNSIIKLGMALYEFKNVEGRPNPITNPNLYAGSVPAFRSKGNSYFDINSSTLDPNDALFGLSSKFREVNITGEIDIAKFNPIHLILTGDYVRNIGFDADEIASRTGLIASQIPDEQVDGYSLQLTVGHPLVRNKGKWQAFVGYKHLEADAVLDSYTNSNFLLRGTNAKGWFMGAQYGIDKNTWLSAQYYSADEIAPRDNLDPLSIDVLHIDLNTEF